ncbi:hypothetical protein CDAR_374431, partial [Caerostris darwini]
MGREDSSPFPRRNGAHHSCPKNSLFFPKRMVQNSSSHTSVSVTRKPVPCGQGRRDCSLPRSGLQPY